MRAKGGNTKIVFKNQPKLSEHEVDNKFNERRLSLIPYVRDYISSHDLFKNKEVNVTFAHKGISSLVCIIETANEKLVLKISLGSHGTAEAQFLRVWEEVGVKVPHVIEDGMLNGHAFTLMEYIDAPILSEIYNNRELLKNGIYFEMGHTLSVMHSPKAEGYGRVVDGKAEFTEFKDWINSEDMKKRYQYVSENMLLGEEHGSLTTAIEILIEHTNNENKSSYCHDDFGTSNMFATHPITIFDPSPKFNNRYIDLGRTLYNHIAKGVFPKQLIDGYFENKPYQEKVLHASILISSYFKFPYSHKKKRLEIMQNIKEYLIQNKHLLD
ncbi:phosphotransferase [Candidatus Nomurabacteria bacterium]|nr:phosphotransferase [Candidatus Nomurabacteria bacterium]